MKKSEYITIGLQYGLQRQDIEDTMCSVLWISSKDFFKMDDIDAKYLYEVQKMFVRIWKGEPQEYIFSTVEFWGNEFFVDDRVLIPRNDTEILVDEVIKEISKNIDTEITTMIDVGTGSSCIPISILGAISPLKFHESYVVDVSPEALEVSSINIKNYKLESQIIPIEGNLLDPFLSSDTYELQKNIFITANLPYIKEGDHKNMDTSVIDFEPDTALYGGEKTGFELYEKLIKQCFQLKNVLKIPSITLFIEIGFDQYEVSKKLLEDFGLQFEYFEDNGKIQRVIKIYNF